MVKNKFGFLIFVLFFVSIVAIGCKQGTEPQTQNETQPGTTADTQDPIDVTDAEITASVKAKLVTDENVAARRINVDTENGVVTLRGTVATPTEADRAVELAKTADGVRLVHSYLKSDDTTEDTKGSISELGDETQDALNKAGDAVETGIDEVEDVGSDAAITAQIKWKLAKDRLVQAADIDVDTKDRHVTLTGTVSNKQEAQRALQIAQSIEDVVKVNSNIRIR